MKYYICFALYLLLLSHLAHSKIIETYTISINPVCAGDNSLLVISGAQIAALSGRSIKQLSLLTFSNAQQALQEIVFQIDQKDAQGRYILSEKNNEDSDRTAKTLTDNDELVFRKKDLKQRIEHSSRLLRQHALIELEVITNSAKAEAKWLYIKLDSDISQVQPDKRLIYNRDQDNIISPLYKMGFSKIHPFLLEHFYWRLPNQAGWSADMIDMMKIRHVGSFLGLPFKRTQGDYFSQLIDVKEGPLRVIRRTENRIKVFWKLKSPALFIDYVMMPDGFVMDTIIDIPFKISFFFSDLATITTMDWNNLAGSSELSVQSSKDYPAMPINGLASDEKESFNQIISDRFALTSSMGDFNVTLDIADDFPIQAHLYLKDNLEALDPPENYPGQFGNIGFKTTGWENIGRQLHHLNFTVCVAAAK